MDLPFEFADIAVIAILTVVAARFVLPGLVVGYHAEIMVGELQIIFGLHPIAIVLRVLCKLLVLVEQLGCIAPRAAVDPVARIRTALIAITAAATAVIVVVAIVVQGITSSFMARRGPSRSAIVPR